MMVTVYWLMKNMFLIATTVLTLGVATFLITRGQQRNDISEIEPTRPAAGATAISAATPSGEIIPRESWAFCGYATPEAAFGSWTWAMMKGDSKIALDSVVPEMRKIWEQVYEGKSESEIVAEAEKESRKIMGYRILQREDISGDEAVLEVQMTEHNKAGPGKPQKIKFLKISGDWKFAGPVR